MKQSNKPYINKWGHLTFPNRERVDWSKVGTPPSHDELRDRELADEIERLRQYGPENPFYASHQKRLRKLENRG